MSLGKYGIRKNVQKRSVLVLDDELINREILRDVLQEDYEVLCMSDPKQALDMMKEKHFSCVLADLVIPGMTGKEVLLELKKRGKDEGSSCHPAVGRGR